jgi:hypothetical protein
MSNRQRRIRDRSAESWGLAMRALGFETVALALMVVAAAICCIGCDWSLPDPPALQVGADNPSDDYPGKPDELPKPEDSYLTPDERVILFDLERSDLLLEKCLKPFFEAIRQGDAAGARTALAAEFQCQLPTAPAMQDYLILCD